MVLPLQIAQPVNIAAAVDRNHLAADHIRFRSVVVRSRPSMEASPRSVSPCSTSFFFSSQSMPTKDTAYPSRPKDSLSQIHIHACRIAVFIGIIKRRIVVAAHLDRYRCFRPVLLHTLGSRTSAQQPPASVPQIPKKSVFESHGFPCFTFILIIPFKIYECPREYDILSQYFRQLFHFMSIFSYQIRGSTFICPPQTIPSRCSNVVAHVDGDLVRASAAIVSITPAA